MYLRKCAMQGDKVVLSREELENWRDVCRQRAKTSQRWQGRFDVLDELLNSLKIYKSKTIMEKKYKEALLKAREAKQNTESAVTIGILEEIFPELKESEDKRMKKTIIHALRGDVILNKKQATRAIDWLEKQGEPKSVDKEYTFKAIPRLLDMIKPTEKAKAYCQKLIDTLKKEGYHTDAKIVGECLRGMNGENVAMAVMDEQPITDKVEPKFKVGDWILLDKPQRMISAEAKEAMYDKTAWSEEDEVKINRIVACLKNLNVADNDILLKDVDWLKSLKERIGG